MSFDYKSKRGHNLNVQLSLTGPANAKREDVETAIQERFDTGKTPKGWKARITEWRGRELEHAGQDHWNVLRYIGPEPLTVDQTGRAPAAGDEDDRESEGDDTE